MELKDAVFGRRSIRRYTDYHVSDDEIREVLEAARFAPSWANVQPCEFIVVRDRPLIEAVTETYTPQNPARKCSMASSVLIVGCVKTGVSGCYDGKTVTKFPNWEMFDLGLAVQNICLRAHDLGLGSVVVGLINHDELKKVLGVPEGYEAVVVVPLGKPAVAAKEGPARRPQSDFVHQNKF